jgi:hypothetical protein
MRILGWKELLFSKRIATVLTRFESTDGYESAKAPVWAYTVLLFLPQFLFFSFFHAAFPCFDISAKAPSQILSAPIGSIHVS